jgi:hypothetical protein
MALVTDLIFNQNKIEDLYLNVVIIIIIIIHFVNNKNSGSSG